MAMTPRTAPAAGRELVFDDAFLHKLEQLELLARKIFRGLLRGERTTSRRGRGLEFSDFRHYWPGDDFRHIDWNIYSRLDQLYLKLHASEEDVTLHLIVDSSASMAFGEPSKFDHARRLAAALAYIALNNLDRVAVSAFAGALGASLPPTKSRKHVAGLLAFLASLPCAGPTRFGTALREFATRTRSPGLVILISDLLGLSEVQDGIEALRHGGHDVVVIQLLAESEIDPPLDGALQIVDAETGNELEVTVDPELRRLYRQRLERQLQEIESFCRRRGVEYLRASTAIGFEDVVLKYLRQGTHLR
ncbi:MAG: DUF58 domain-containing protein [Betaproteobacteria bacterium]|nr:DUF58 domain-containing protein [Betaproteobacteria bacterium]